MSGLGEGERWREDEEILVREEEEIRTLVLRRSAGYEQLTGKRIDVYRAAQACGAEGVVRQRSIKSARGLPAPAASCALCRGQSRGSAPQSPPQRDGTLGTCWSAGTDESCRSPGARMRAAQCMRLLLDWKRSAYNKDER